LLHRLKEKCFKATQSLSKRRVFKQHNRFIASKRKVLRATQSLHLFSRIVKGPKHRKIAVFKKGLKRQHRFIGSFLRVQSIGVALVDPFLWIAPTTGRATHAA
jgi:hypothetical protein